MNYLPMKLLSYIALSAVALLVHSAALCAGTFAPPTDKTLRYRYTRSATSQSARSYDYGSLSYTIDLQVRERSHNRITCSFAIRDLERIGLDDDEDKAFPGTGTIILNASGTVVETTIDTYLVQPDMEELNDFIQSGLGDNALFYRTTFFFIPSFADNSLSPGDTLDQPRTSLHKGDDNDKSTKKFRLADTVLKNQETAVYGKIVRERFFNFYEQSYYNYYKTSEMLSEERLWWSPELKSAMLYESSIENTDVTGLTGQIQQVGNSYTETYVRLELLSVQ